MNAHPHVKAACKALTKVKALTKNIVRSAEYWGSSAGRSLHYYNQEQGEAGLKRKKGRLRGQMRKLNALSYEAGIDVEAGRSIRALCDVTEIVLQCCEHFPRAHDWPGLEPLGRQERLIAKARAQLKRRLA